MLQYRNHIVPKWVLAHAVLLMFRWTLFRYCRSQIIFLSKWVNRSIHIGYIRTMIFEIILRMCQTTRPFEKVSSCLTHLCLSKFRRDSPFCWYIWRIWRECWRKAIVLFWFCNRAKPSCTFIWFDFLHFFFVLILNKFKSLSKLKVNLADTIFLPFRFIYLSLIEFLQSFVCDMTSINFIKVFFLLNWSSRVNTELNFTVIGMKIVTILKFKVIFSMLHWFSFCFLFFYNWVLI